MFNRRRSPSRLIAESLYRAPVFGRSDVSKKFEKIPADEFARRHGWRKSAVIHRIRAGICDGIRENGTWYVLRGVPPESEGGVVSEKATPGYEYVEYAPPDLPWPTVPGPFVWVSRVRLVAFGALVAVAFLDTLERSFAVVALALVVAGVSLLYEGLRTGVMRNGLGFYTAYSRHPVQYVMLGLSYLGFAIMGLFLLVMAVFGWPRAV